MSQSSELFEKSQALVPGGVHSPVRSFKGLTSTPLFFEKAAGAKFTDVDGKDYIDFCMSFGPLIHGHMDLDVRRELEKQLARGWSYGACEPYSVHLAEFLVNKLPHVDQIRFVNSGTEAVMTALRLARGFTGRDKIIKFNGCYHGHVDSMLIKAGSGLAGSAEASSAGVPERVAEDTLILELGDLEAVKACFDAHKEQIAALIIEPLPANNGLLIQDRDYLQGLREITKNHNALLIFDEVISGFRIGFGGMTAETGITPDVVTYGKIIGGGLPVGALGGRHEIMQMLAPVGPVYQAGTLSANPLAMVAGMAALSKLTDADYNRLAGNTERIVSLFTEWLAEYDRGRFSDFQIVKHGSLFWLVAGEVPVRACDIAADLMQKFVPLFETLLQKGIYLAPNPYEVSFVSLAHDDDIIAELKNRLWR